MNEKWKVLYAGLCADAAAIERTHPGGLEQGESCFRVCLGYWEEVKQLARSEGFGCDRGEIEFFKCIKPQFTGQLEYYSLVYQFYLFCPSRDGAERVAFVDNERSKLLRFEIGHRAILQYVASGQTDRDAEYFLVRNRPADGIPYARPYDMDPALLTAADWILSVFAGHGLYGQFLASEKSSAPAIRGRPDFRPGAGSL